MMLKIFKKKRLKGKKEKNKKQKTKKKKGYMYEKAGYIDNISFLPKQVEKRVKYLAKKFYLKILSIL